MLMSQLFVVCLFTYQAVFILYGSMEQQLYISCPYSLFDYANGNQLLLWLVELSRQLHAYQSFRIIIWFSCPNNTARGFKVVVDVAVRAVYVLPLLSMCYH